MSDTDNLLVSNVNTIFLLSFLSYVDVRLTGGVLLKGSGCYMAPIGHFYKKELSGIGDLETVGRRFLLITNRKS